MNSVVYWIHHPDHTDMLSQGYIGVTNNAKVRWNQHKNNNENVHLKHAMNKYVWDNLIKEVIVIADRDYCLDLELKLRPDNKIGWNLIMGGGNPPNIPWNKGIPANPEHIKRMNDIRLKQPNHRKGVVLSEEIKAKMGAPKIGIKQTPEHIEKCRKAKLGKKQNLSTCPHCNKVGGSQTMPRWHFDKCKQKGIN